MKILLVGAGGFIGSQIALNLIEDGHDLVSDKDRFNVKRERIDVLVPESYLDILTSLKPEVVISTAWETTPGEFWNSPRNQEYAEANSEFAQKCFQLGVKHFIGLGTMSEYGESVGACDASITEPKPLNVYGESKLIAGIELTKLAEKYSKRSTWLRIFQAYGLNEKSQRFLPSLLRSFKQNQQVNLKTPLDTLDWINVKDIARIIGTLIYTQSPPIVDVGSGETRTVLDVARIALDRSGADDDLIQVNSQNLMTKRSLYLAESVFLNELNWKPIHTLKSYIDDYFAQGSL